MFVDVDVGGFGFGLAGVVVVVGIVGVREGERWTVILRRLQRQIEKWEVEEAAVTALTVPLLQRGQER